MDPNEFLRRYRQHEAILKQAEALRRAMNPLGSVFSDYERLAQVQASYEQTYRRLLGSADASAQLARVAQNLEITRLARYQGELKDWERLRKNLLLTSNFDVLAQQLAISAPIRVESTLQKISTLLARPAWVSIPPSLKSALYDPALAYSTFARSSLEYVGTGGRVDSNAIEASVVLADTQLDDATTVLTAFLDDDDEHVEHSEPSSEEVQRVEGDSVAEALFSKQQHELREAELGPNPEYNEIIEVSPSARQVQLGHELVGAVVELNQARKLVGSAEIFPPTTAMLGAANVLCYAGVASKVELGTAVDALYVLLYEGAGDAQRITHWIDASACEALWTLKQLRNVWLRHDPEHGSSTDQAKKFQKLRGGLGFLGLTHLPTNPIEFQLLYERLLHELLNMLGELKLRVFSSHT